jgi:hypothetical protein
MNDGKSADFGGKISTAEHAPSPRAIAISAQTVKSV